MKDVDHACEPHRVDGSVGVAVIVINDLQNACSFEALKRLRIRMLLADLSQIERVADLVLNVFRQALQVISR
jgi:hypothetical protein